MKRSFFLLALALVICSGVAADAVPNAPYKTKHVVILVIDGPRWTETWGESQRQYIPVRNKVLAPQGVLFTDMGNDGPTYTNAGHTALTTGYYQDINNNGLELPEKPTITQYLLRDRQLDPKQAWIVASKDKLQIITDSKSAEWKHKYICSFDCGVGGAGVGAGYRDDATTFAKVKEVLTTHHPVFTLINFKEPDPSGHAKKWDNYLQGIRDTDHYAGEIWALIQADPVLKDTTALFITNDHGRHLDGLKDGFVSHGDDCAGCRQIELLAMGPDFKRGEVVPRHRGQIDIAVTVATLLGVTLAGSSGQVISELFITPPGLKKP
jgi:Metalloenzyme superfamily